MDDVLRVPRIRGARNLDDASLRSALMEGGCRGKIDQQSWDACRVDPNGVSVWFFLGYEKAAVYVLFRVVEPEIRAVNTKRQSQVCQDSCVELFIQGRDARYGNFEFNPLGTVLAGVGRNRYDRVAPGPDFFAGLRVWSSYAEDPKHGRGSGGAWELLAGIPLDLLGISEPGGSLAGCTMRANLYKCGDLLQTPHFFSWRPITTDEPDFHQSRFFGKVEFLA